jgi:hypothetical protein
VEEGTRTFEHIKGCADGILSERIKTKLFDKDLSQYPERTYKYRTKR